MKIEIRRFGTFKITLLSLAILAIFAATPASSASTSHVVIAKGSFTASTTLVSVNIGPQKTTIFATFTDTITGTIKVTYVGTIVFYEYPNGVLTFQEAGVATGTIGPSKIGTALFIGGGTGVVGGAVEGNGHYTDGTGGLAGSHGSLGFQGTATSATTFAGTYQGVLHLS